MEKINLEKKISSKNRKFSFFQLENRFFQVKNLLEKIDFPIEKMKIFDFCSRFFFKINFLHDEKIFFDGISF